MPAPQLAVAHTEPDLRLDETPAAKTTSRSSYPGLVRLSPAGYKVVEACREAGGRPLIVGGSVRDALLGDHRPKDLDIGIYDRYVVVAATLLHDVGKAVTTTRRRDAAGMEHIVSPGHAEAGAPIAERFLRSIDCLEHLRQRIVPLVAEHMAATTGEPTHRAVRRLARRLAPATMMNGPLSSKPTAQAVVPIPSGPRTSTIGLVSRAKLVPAGRRPEG